MNIALLTTALLAILAPCASTSDEDEVSSTTVCPSTTSTNHSLYDNKRNCPCRPLCSRGLGYTHPVCWNLPSLKYRYRSSNANIGDIHTCLYSLFQQIHGQKSSIETLVGQINRKLYDPQASFVVHLAGDNGVGKTMSAALLSTAIALYPHNSHTNAGETLLIFPGSEFANVSGESPEGLRSAAQQIRSRLIAHVQSFPNCVVLFDEITQIHPALMQELNPIFAAIEHGEPLDSVPMTGVFCFLTSDFGSNGRTLGMTPVEVRTMVWEVIQQAYQNVPVFKKANIVPFVSLSPSDFQDAIRYRLRTLKCHHERKKSLFGNAIIQVVDFAFDEETVVQFLYSKILSGIPQRNGREIDRIFDDYIEGPMILKLAQFEIQTSEKLNIGQTGQRMPSAIENLWFGSATFHVVVSFRVEGSGGDKESEKRMEIDVRLLE